MALREGLLLILVISWATADASTKVNVDVIVTEVDLEIPRTQIQISETVNSNDQLCTVCEQFAGQAAQYLGQNKTQTEIIETLHQACHELQPFEEQCVLLVDYYASIFFLEISKIHPKEFCTKFNLCNTMVSVSPINSDNSCSFCHDVVAKFLVKMKDPDTQFELIKMLLKECNEVEQYVQECKKLVLHYGPLILVNGEKFLENTDVCSAIHACKTNQVELNTASMEEPSLVESM